jgi:antitoxin ParD1/3/4
MTLDSPLTPHLERFVRDQLATGRFRSASDLISAALRLLEEQSLSLKNSKAWPTRVIDAGLTSGRSEPLSNEFWQELRQQLRPDRSPANDEAANPSERHSPRGLLADLRSNLTFDDIKEARSEMWAGFRHGQI